ncbi:MAG: OmpA family protein [Alphaproteobacteria bacterium]|nr:MAG: OmpA family protein [Alphaproteobacteria bacterium]
MIDLKVTSLAAVTALATSLAAHAETTALEFPAAPTLVAEETIERAAFAVPNGPFNAETGDVEAITAIDGMAVRAWRFPAGGMTTGAVASDLVTQLSGQGFEVLFQCESWDCGGFDFRYAIDVLPEPDMHVDLGDFQFISARRVSDGKPEYICLVVSRGGEFAYVQMTHVGGISDTPAPAVLSTKSATPAEVDDIADVSAPASGDLAALLDTKGRLVLEDIHFATGSSELSERKAPSLAALADYLRAHPDLRVVLVGHTDAEGSRAANLAISRRRAAAVADALVGEFGVPAARIAAEGAGYLAPRSSNLTPEGRALNRRVEAVVLPLD